MGNKKRTCGGVFRPCRSADVRGARRRILTYGRLAELREGVWMRPANLAVRLPDPLEGDIELMTARPVDAAALAHLESIVHPLVAKARDAFIAEAQARGAPVILLDVPLLFETGGERHCDAVVVVSAPLDIQRRRAFERPGMTEEKFAALVGKQVPDAEKRRRADFIVDSSQSFDHARAQVRDILRAIAKMLEGRGDSAK